jgi:hypothetical protein
MNLKFVGKWAFLVGLVIAVLASFLTGYATTVALVLFVLGLVVTGGIASMSAISMLGIVSTYLVTILGSFVAFVSAAALVVAIKAIFETSKK